jgi:hypothetical protein
MTKEKHYLKELGDMLDYAISRIKNLTGAEDNEKLLHELKNLLGKETKLRAKCELGGRFKVVHVQLQSLLKRFEIKIREMQQVSPQISESKDIPMEDEQLVYVYLFNAQGEVLKSWENLLLPDSLIEHSVNRPIYIDKEQIETILRTKTKKMQHAYLEIIIKKKDILATTRHNSGLHDQFGFKLLRLKQGALKVEKIRKFVHNDQIYHLSKNNKLIRD